MADGLSSVLCVPWTRTMYYYVLVSSGDSCECWAIFWWVKQQNEELTVIWNLVTPCADCQCISCKGHKIIAQERFLLLQITTWCHSAFSKILITAWALALHFENSGLLVALMVNRVIISRLAWWSKLVWAGEQTKALPWTVASSCTFQRWFCVLVWFSFPHCWKWTQNLSSWEYYPDCEDVLKNMFDC